MLRSRPTARAIVAYALLAGIAAVRADAPADHDPIPCGISRRIPSAVLREDRTLLIRLPEDYNKTDQRYPVLYKLDGSRGVFLQTAATVDYLADMTDQAPDHIVVAIENTDRNRDMSPGRGAGPFVQFLKDELIPYVDREYRTNGFKILGGQSLSSVFALYAFLREPEAFDGYVLSSFGLSPEWLKLFQDELQKMPAGTGRTKHLFISNAKTDSYDPDGSRTRNGLLFIDSLRRSAGPALLIEYRIYENEGHVPFPTIYDALKWIYAPETTKHWFEPPAPAEPIPGIITDWALSPTVRAFNLGPERYLDGQAPATIAWLPVRSEPSGLVDIARYRQPVAKGISKVWARTVIQARQKESRPFCFGYSDDISLYLNGQILYRGQSGSQRRDPSSPGIIGWNDTVYLPLEKGENELVLMVSEQFGGWSFMGRDLDAIYYHPALQPAWELAGRLSAPESVAYDAGRQVLYVSNFGDDCISKIGLDGTIVALKWVTGLKAPTGLKFFAGKLYAVERAGVAEIDPEQGVVIARHPIPNAAFPNDLAIAGDGTIYVTDSFKNCVFSLSGGKAEMWIEGKVVENPNGLLIERERLLVGVTSDGTIKSVDLQTKQVRTFLTLAPGANMDGLVTDGKSGYLFSDYYGRIYRADAEGRRTLLLDRMGPHQYTADFEYVPATGLLIVPSLYDNRLTAYRLTNP